MDDSTVSTMLRDLADAPAPPSSVDVRRATVTGRRRIRARRIIGGGSAAASVTAVVAVVGLLATGTPTRSVPSGRMPAVAPSHFDPFVQYAAFGWLPEGALGMDLGVNRDWLRLGAYYDSLGSRLERLYAGRPDSAALAAGRAEVAAWAREEVRDRVAPAMRTVRLQPADRPVNNARIIAARIYRTRLDLFEAWFQREGADVRRAVPALRTLVEGAEGDAAMARLEAALGGASGGGP